jgi:hypothetical protein
MDLLGWLVVIFLLFVFGKHAQGTLSLSLGQQNSVPGSGTNLPVISDQNTNNPPSNQPAPWRNRCGSIPNNPVAATAIAPINVPQPSNPTTAPVRVQRSQPSY